MLEEKKLKNYKSTAENGIKTEKTRLKTAKQTWISAQYTI